jgi:hypothetical protein
MSEEEKKKIVSEPPPPTDEIDGEWGDDDQTLVREVPEGVIKSQPAPPSGAVGATAVAPISVPVKAAEASTPPEMKAAAPVPSEDEEEDDEDDEDETSTDNEDDADESEEDEDESEEDEDEDDALAHPAQPAAAARDWLPDWAPFAVLAVLVSVSILVGLGLVGGGPAKTAEDAEAEGTKTGEAKPAAKPSQHP